MKIMIVYASVGAGHTNAARAIHSYFRERVAHSDVRIVDCLHHTNIMFKNSYVWEYYLLIKYAPLLWGLGYRLTGNRFLRPITRPVGTVLNKLNTARLSRFLISEKPDVVISTHFLPSEIVSNLKKSKKLKVRLFTVVTDYVVHPFWISPGVDNYIVASGVTKQLLMREGISEGRIKDIGIPVREEFTRKYEKARLAEKLGIAKDKFSVLIVTGSFGVGPIEEIVGLLHKEVQLIVICANNKRLYNKLKQLNFPGVRVHGFVKNMHELMRVSDIIITKPGGATVSEALDTGLVPVFIRSIPGQETGNAAVLGRYGVGFSVRSISEIKTIVLDFKNNPGKLSQAREKIKNIRKPDTLGDLFNAVCESGSRPAC